MLVSELKKRLDVIAWHEQVEQEMSERPAVASPANPGLTDAELLALAKSVDGALLDSLEKEEGYLVWTLRLAPLVEPTRAKQRAQPYVDSTNWRLRHWARQIAGLPP